MEHFVFDPKQYGLPDYKQLKEYRIWDNHYHGLGGLNEEGKFYVHKQLKYYINKMGIEYMISHNDHSSLPDPSQKGIQREMEYLKEHKSSIAGYCSVDPGYPEQSVKKIETYVENGPFIGVYTPPGSRGITVSNPKCDKIYQKAAEVDAVINIHTWIKTGTAPRNVGGGTIGGANWKGENTPMDVAALAQRMPDVPIIAGHGGGGMWQIGIQAVQEYENVFVEVCAGPPTSGMMDLAVDRVGADRIVWGGHPPSRTWATELGKVFESSLLDESGRKKVLGENIRRLAKPICENKGINYKI